LIISTANPPPTVIAKPSTPRPAGETISITMPAITMTGADPVADRDQADR
jgi:hypothetical protein